MPASLDFDPGLPRLWAVDDPGTAARLIAPALTRPMARRQDTKYEPGVRCVAAYELRRGTGPGPPVLGAVVVTPAGVDGHPLTADRALPGLRAALDETAMAERLARVVPVTGACSATPLRYKPGARCVIRYDLGGTVLYGKLLADGSETAVRLAGELRSAASRVKGAPRVLPVTGHWPDLGLVVQPAVEGGIELHPVLGDPSVPSATRRSTMAGAGAALAALHDCPPIGAPARSFADDLSELRGYHRAVSRVDAALGARFLDLVGALERLDAQAERAVTSHGAFRTDQLVLSAGRYVLIDLDTVCRAEPARDVGNLLAYLEWKAIRRPELAGDVAALRGSFLDGYAERGHLPAQARLAAYTAASLLKIAGRRFRSLTVAEWPRVPSLLDLAQRMAAVPEMGRT